MKVVVYSPNHCWLFHHWETISNNGFTVYEECKKCYSRQAKQPDTGYQPIDSKWLMGDKQ